MKFFIFFSLLLFTEVAFAQYTYEDEAEELDAILSATPQDRHLLTLDSLITISIERKEWGYAALCLHRQMRANWKNSKEALRIVHSEKAKLILKFLSDDDILRTNLLTETGYHYRKMKNYGAALASYENSLAIFNSLKIVNERVIYTYRKAGDIAIRFLDYEKANAHFQAVIAIDTSGKWLPEAYTSLAKSCNFQREFPQAIHYYLKASELVNNSIDVFMNNCEGAIAYASWQAPEKALNLLDLNFKLIQKEKSRFRQKYFGDYYLNCANVYVLLGNVKKAKIALQKSIQFSKEKYKKRKDREVAKLYFNLGELLFDESNFTGALQAFHNAMIQVFPKFNNPASSSNPSLQEVVRESFQMTSAKKKAQTYLKLYEEDKDTEWLKSAEACFDILFFGAKKIRETFSDEDAKFYLEHFNEKSLEQAIYTCYLLFETYGDSSYLHKAFILSEQHKSLVLREAIVQQEMLMELELPDSLLVKESLLQETVNDLKLEIQGDKIMKDHLTKKLSEAQNEYGLFLTNLKKEYPDFVRKLEQQKLVSISEIQSQLLNDRTMLLQFHWGDEMLFIFQITKDEIKLKRLDRKILEPQLNDFLGLLINRNAQEESPVDYFHGAYFLSEHLLDTTLINQREIEKLIIIPDGRLSSLPFEVLLTKEWQGGFGKAPFLLHRFGIQYAYSSSLLLQKKTEKKLSGILAIAPLFENYQRGLPMLLGSEEELKAIDYPEKKQILGSAATLSAFQQNIKNKQIIHLSTHAKSNEENLPPKIEFIDTCLYLPQLYTMQIPAELVVLSTCESNLGVYEEGEGVMSLSRGFTYAGAESMIASLWAVNEKSTSTLFGNYYNRIDKYSKSEALRGSKLDYLQNTQIQDRLKAPYYWAGFVFIGNDGMINRNRGFSGLFYGGLFFLLAFLAFCFYSFTLNKN